MSKPRPRPRPGQVYLDTKGWSIATIYSVTSSVIRAVVTKTDCRRIRAGRNAFWCITWKNGIPDHYAIQYNPPERNDE